VTTSAQQPRADVIFTNGHVLTVDASDRVVQAVAVAANKIIAVGSNADVERTAGLATRRIDLRGRALTPGLLDAHDHFSSSGADRLYVLDLSYPNVKSIADVVAAVRAKVATVPKGAWIQGRGWDEGKLTERRLISAKDLDAAAPDNPVFLTQTTGHYGVANSAALKLGNVTKDTRDPPGSTIDRAPDGSPSGVLKEGAMGLVRRHIPPRNPGEIEAGIRDFVKAFNAEGMTGLKDPGIAGGVWDTYKKIEASGDLNVRVFALGAVASVGQTIYNVFWQNIATNF